MFERQLIADYLQNLELLEKGICNLEKHLHNISQIHKLPVVVAINRHHTDTDQELELVKKRAVKAGAFDALVARHWELGGEGALDLAKSVFEACNQKERKGEFLYDLELPIKVCTNN